VQYQSHQSRCHGLHWPARTWRLLWYRDLLLQASQNLRRLLSLKWSQRRYLHQHRCHRGEWWVNSFFVGVCLSAYELLLECTEQQPAWSRTQHRQLRSPIEDAIVSAVCGALSALEALCENALYKLTLTLQGLWIRCKFFCNIKHGNSFEGTRLKYVQIVVEIIPFSDRNAYVLCFFIVLCGLSYSDHSVCEFLIIIVWLLEIAVVQ